MPAADTASAETLPGRIAATFSRLPPDVTLWLAVASLSAIFTIFGYVLYTSRQEVGNSAWTASINLVGVVSQQIDREIELLDMSLLRLCAIAERHDVMTLPPDSRDAVLFGWPAAALLPVGRSSSNQHSDASSKARPMVGVRHSVPGRRTWMLPRR